MVPCHQSSEPDVYAVGGHGHAAQWLREKYYQDTLSLSLAGCPCFLRASGDLRLIILWPSSRFCVRVVRSWICQVCLVV